MLPAERLPPLRRQVLHIGVHINVGRGQQIVLLLRGTLLLDLLRLFLRRCSAVQLLRLFGQGQGLWWLHLGLGQLQFFGIYGPPALEKVGDHGALALHIHAAATGELEATPLEYLLHLLCHLARCEKKEAERENKR